MCDWRDTLFCWRGVLSATEGGGGKERVMWSGTWVGSEDGELPTQDQFEQSKNKFQLSAEAALAAVAGSEVVWKGWYKLDNGDGLDNVEDWSHACAFGEPAAAAVPSETEAASAGDADAVGSCVVAAKGTTEFGQFISRGRLVDDTLVLCRRYVDDKDARLKEELPMAVEAARRDHAAAPWRDAITSRASKKLKTGTKRKRKA